MIEPHNPTIYYRIRERIGTNEDFHWGVTDTGIFTRMPRFYGAEPTMEDAKSYAATFNNSVRQIEFSTYDVY